jgi:hypothetical protein
MIDFITAGGWGMYPTMLFGFFLAVSSMLTLLRPARSWAVIALLGVVTLCSGVLGTSMGIINTFRHASASNEDVGNLLRLSLGGVAESLNNMVLAFVIVVPCTLVCIVAAWKASRPPVAAPAGAGK